MSAKEFELDRLLGMRVVDPGRRNVGHIEEVRAQRSGDVWEVTEYHIGTAALMERLSARVFPFPRKSPRGYAAAWNQIDVTGRKVARLLCPVDDLRKITRHRPGKRRKKEDG